MAPRDNVQAVLSRVGKQEWFFQRLLGETLEWPVGADRDVDDLSHGRLKTFARPILNVKLSRAASGRFSHSLTASLGESLPWNSRILKLWWHVAAWLAFCGRFSGVWSHRGARLPAYPHGNANTCSSFVHTAGSISATDPDAIAPDKRKATGSYYTPRIVVHFICREALYQYLLGQLPANGVQHNWGSRLKTLLSLDASDGIDDEKRHRGRVSLRRRMRGRLLIQRGILSDGEVEGFKKLTENVTEGGVPYVERRVRLPRFCRLLELVIVEQATVQEGNTR